MKRRQPHAALPLVAMTLVCLAAVSPAAGQDPPSGNSVLRGRIFGSSGEPLSDATVLAYHLSSERLFESDPTDAKGEYELRDLPYGYFDVAVRTDQGLFVADVVVNVAPSAETVASMTVGALVTDQLPRAFPGTEVEPVGTAAVVRRESGFWRSRKGIGVLAGLGGAALLTIASDGDNSSASPVNP